MTAAAIKIDKEFSSSEKRSIIETTKNIDTRVITKTVISQKK